MTKSLLKSRSRFGRLGRSSSSATSISAESPMSGCIAFGLQTLAHLPHLIAISKEDCVPRVDAHQGKLGSRSVSSSVRNQSSCSSRKLRAKARIVCDACNKGWMSELETSVRPILSSLMFDISYTLDLSQQHVVVEWAPPGGLLKRLAPVPDRMYVSRYNPRYRLLAAVVPLKLG